MILLFLDFSISSLSQIFQQVLDAFRVTCRSATARPIHDDRPFQCKRTLLSETYQTFRRVRSIWQRWRRRMRRYQRGNMVRIVDIANARKVVQDGAYLVSSWRSLLDDLQVELESIFGRTP